MRTQQKLQIEAIVAKYENLAAQTPVAKAAQEELSSDFFRAMGSDVDFNVTLYSEQLLARIYKLRAGDKAEGRVLKDYPDVDKYYSKGILSEQEEQYLVEHFAVFTEYMFEHIQSHELGVVFNTPDEWSRLVPYLLEKQDGKLLIPASDKGKEFAGLGTCDVTVGIGYAGAAIQALAQGDTIHYKDVDGSLSEMEDALSKSLEGSSDVSAASAFLSDVPSGTFDAAIFGVQEFSDGISTIQPLLCYTAIRRLVKEGGEILMSLSRAQLLNKDCEPLRQFIISSKELQEAIQLPSGSILFHLSKKVNKTFVMAKALEKKAKMWGNVVDAEAFHEDVLLANTPEGEAQNICRRFSYDSLKEDMLLPAYYLDFPTEGAFVSEVADGPSEKVSSDDCSSEEVAVTLNELTDIFSGSEFCVSDLPLLNKNRFRHYWRVESPCVVFAASGQDIAVGYTKEHASILVPATLHVLIPKEGISAEYLASCLFRGSLRDQVLALVYGEGLSAKLPKGWETWVRIKSHTKEEQSAIVNEALQRDFARQKVINEEQSQAFIRSMHLRKHALSQNVAAFSSMFHTLERCMKDHYGNLKNEFKLSPVSDMTVEEAMSFLHENIGIIAERVAHLTDEQNWGDSENIEPQKFIEDYEKEHTDSRFEFQHMWEVFEPNCFHKDVVDPNTGKVLFKKGESMNLAWFPQKALTQVFDDIIANAVSHGFTDKNRTDFTVRFRWTIDGLKMHIDVSNNGSPIPADVDTRRILDYGYSSSLNKNGHGGLGGGEIAELMHKFGGDVKVISTPKENFTVTYRLSLPVASLC